MKLARWNETETIEVEGWRLRLRLPTGSERLAILDVVRSGQEAGLVAHLDRLIEGWDGLCDARGAAIPCTTSEGGREVRLFDRALGAMPRPMMERVIQAVLAFCGLGPETGPTPPPESDSSGG